MDRRALLAGAAALLAAPLSAGAQSAAKVYRIGILGDKASDAYETLAWQTFWP
jgi:hypothetical protein